MTRWSYIILVNVLLGPGLLYGCKQGPASISPSDPSPSDKVQVVVSILPQQYFVKRIGGDNVAVSVMVGPGDEPHTYEPKSEQLKALSQADTYMRIQVDFEQAWMDRIQALNSKMLIVDTTQGIERIPIAAHHHGDEETHHADEGEKDTAAKDTEIEHPDPHIWLSPQRVKIQARTIYNALVDLDPDNKPEYQENLQRFLTDIDALDAEIRNTLEGVQTRKFMVFHPAWGYFARDYGLEMIPVEVGGTEPSAAELAALITQAKAENIKVIFAQPAFSTKDAETIARQIGGEVVPLDPLAPDWLENLRQVGKTFGQTLSQTSVMPVWMAAIFVRVPKMSGHRLLRSPATINSIGAI